MTEWISLKATLHSLNNDRFNCAKCMNQYNGRADAEPMLQRAREVNGCWGGEIARHTISDSMNRTLRFSSCIGNFVQPHWNHWLNLHQSYRAGHLPFPGSVSDQPNKVMEVFRTMDAYYSEQQAEQIKEQQRANAPKMRGARG